MSIRMFVGSDPNYVTLGGLGSGAFGTVTKVQHKASGRVLACKAIQFTADKAELIQREVIALRALVGCRNVVQWMEDISYDVATNQIHLHMEYYPDGTLETLINPQRGTLVPKDTVIQVFCCMAMALLDCHSRGIIHRDIKPANILLSKKMSEGQVVTVAYLADFGIGKFYTPMLMAANGAGSVGVGTPLYMAPESITLSNPYYGPESDMFSLGCVMYELCNQQRAYNSWSRTYIPVMNPLAALTYGSRLTALITQCLALSPYMRVNTAGLKTALQVYCATRWQKKAAESLWINLAVRAALGGYTAQQQQVPWQAPFQAGPNQGFRGQPVAQPVAPVALAPAQFQPRQYHPPDQTGHGCCNIL